MIVAATVLFLACGSSATDCTLVPTPGGLSSRGCVHEVPSGAMITTGADGSTVVTLSGSVVATYPPCPCARSDVG